MNPHDPHKRTAENITKLSPGDTDLLITMLKEIKGTIDKNTHRFGLEFRYSDGSVGTNYETIEILKKIQPTKDFYKITEKDDKYLTDPLYYPHFTLDQINAILKGLGNKIKEDIMKNLTRELSFDYNRFNFTYDKNNHITVTFIPNQHISPGASYSQPKLPPRTPPPPPPPPPHTEIFPSELRIFKIKNGLNTETGKYDLPEEFLIGLPNADYADLTKLSSVLQIKANIKSRNPVIYTAKDGSEKESYNKTVHTHPTGKYYYIILTFENIQTIINNFEDLKRKGVSGDQILNFLNKIYAEMITYKTESKTKTTPVFDTFLPALTTFINDKNVEIATQLSLSHRYKYLKYKMKYLELKNKNKL